MRSRTRKVTFPIILICILTVLLELVLAYFLPISSLVVGISLILQIVLCHFLIEKSFGFRTIFVFSCWRVLLYSTLYILNIYLPQYFKDYILVPTGIMVLISWLIPFLVATIRDLNNNGTRFIGYRSYFIKASVLFWICYLAFFIYLLYIKQYQFPLLPNTTLHQYYLPFNTTATYIEQSIRNDVSLIPFIHYVLRYIALFIPFGFWIRVLLRNNGRLLRALCYLLTPALIELCQWYFAFGVSDIDD